MLVYKSALPEYVVHEGFHSWYGLKMKLAAFWMILALCTGMITSAAQVFFVHEMLIIGKDILVCIGKMSLSQD